MISLSDILVSQNSILFIQIYLIFCLIRSQIIGLCHYIVRWLDVKKVMGTINRQQSLKDMMTKVRNHFHNEISLWGEKQTLRLIMRFTALTLEDPVTPSPLSTAGHSTAPLSQAFYLTKFIFFSSVKKA